ncbi:S-adenosyl-L-methionine-dependent methyltransferase [Pelagophyceae sp. CCMP2097]|nr:S-adenosyl-L-methionine-dependent methyltransferase [Pelagophyceae sp. CCMP2097]
MARLLFLAACLSPASASDVFSSPEASVSAVRAQYEQFSYPMDDSGLDTGAVPSQYLWMSLPALNHHAWGGRRNTFDGLRVLIAGCGTGAQVLGFAHLLAAYKGTHVAGVDLAPRSIAITKRRLARYGLDDKGVSLRAASLLAVGGDEPYDVIVCTGVLHHLPDPAEGLRVLRSVLKPDGAMVLMVYGAAARVGVYQMQDLMQILTPNLSLEAKLDQLKQLDANMPPTNVLRRTLWPRPLTDLPDVELVDLILHRQDRAYTVPEFYDFVDAANLTIALWEPEVRAKLERPLPSGVGAGLGGEALNAANELIFGDVRMLKALVLPRGAPTPPSVRDARNMVVLNHVLPAGLDSVAHQLDKCAAAETCDVSQLTVPRGMRVPGPGRKRGEFFDVGGRPLEVPLPRGPPELRAVLAAVLREVDGKRTTSAALRRARAAVWRGPHAAQLADLADFDSVALALLAGFYDALQHEDVLVLRRGKSEGACAADGCAEPARAADDPEEWDSVSGQGWGLP